METQIVLKSTALKEPVSREEDISSYNVGSSNYAQYSIQPWAIWEEYNLNPWEADIVKRILRTKRIEGKTKEESRLEDLEKILHITKELIRQQKLKIK